MSPITVWHVESKMEGGKVQTEICWMYRFVGHTEFRQNFFQLRPSLYCTWHFKAKCQMMKHGKTLAFCENRHFVVVIVVGVDQVNTKHWIIDAKHCYTNLYVISANTFSQIDRVQSCLFKTNGQTLIEQSILMDFSFSDVQTEFCSSLKSI